MLKYINVQYFTIVRNLKQDYKNYDSISLILDHYNIENKEFV